MEPKLRNKPQKKQTKPKCPVQCPISLPQYNNASLITSRLASFLRQAGFNPANNLTSDVVASPPFLSSISTLLNYHDEIYQTSLSPPHILLPPLIHKYQVPRKSSKYTQKHRKREENNSILFIGFLFFHFNFLDIWFLFDVLRDDKKNGV